MSYFTITLVIFLCRKIYTIPAELTFSVVCLTIEQTGDDRLLQERLLVCTALDFWFPKGKTPDVLVAAPPAPWANGGQPRGCRHGRLHRDARRGRAASGLGRLEPAVQARLRAVSNKALRRHGMQAEEADFPPAGEEKGGLAAGESDQCTVLELFQRGGHARLTLCGARPDKHGPSNPCLRFGAVCLWRTLNPKYLRIQPTQVSLRKSRVKQLNSAVPALTSPRPLHKDRTCLSSVAERVRRDACFKWRGGATQNICETTKS